MTLQEATETIDIFHGSPLTVLSDCLRGFLIPAEGHDFIACDFSAIEARVIAWLSGEESVLEIFRTHEMIYEAQASSIFRVEMADVDAKQRDVGKVGVLSFGFAGGVGAFQQMAKNFGLKVTDAEADGFKLAWRAANPNIVRYWYGLEQAAISAILNPGTRCRAGATGREVTYLKNGSFLFCKLPSNRVITYPYPQIEPKLMKWGAIKDTISFMAEDSETHRWERVTTYGGSLCENVTQAVARDLLVEAMFRVEAARYPIVLHVHDELVSEVPKGFGSVEEMENLIKEVPVWASGLPMNAKGWRGDRYRK